MNTAIPDLQTTTRRRTLSPQAARWVLILGLAGLFDTWMGGQYLGYRFACHPILGPSLFGISPGSRGYVLAAAFACLGIGLHFTFRRGNRALAVPLVTVAGVLGIGLLGPIYSPFQFVRWAMAYRDVPELVPIVSDSLLVGAVGALAMVIGALAILDTRPRRRVSSSHGTAHWGAAKRSEDRKDF